MGKLPFVKAASVSHIHYKDFREHLKSNGSSFPGIVRTKCVPNVRGTRSAHHIMFLLFLVLGVAFYDETKMMLYRRKSHVIGYNNHRHTKILQNFKIGQIIHEYLSVAFLYVLRIL